jgi:flagellin
LINTNILGIKNLDVSTRGGAQDAITRVKKGLEKISSTRSDIGAQQNRLEHTIRHQECTIENTQTAESRIRDTDMAKEMVAFSASDIIQQAGQAMLTQSNQSNQGVLSLLR